MYHNHSIIIALTLLHCLPTHTSWWTSCAFDKNRSYHMLALGMGVTFFAGLGYMVKHKYYDYVKGLKKKQRHYTAELERRLKAQMCTIAQLKKQLSCFKNCEDDPFADDSSPYELESDNIIETITSEKEKLREKLCATIMKSRQEVTALRTIYNNLEKQRLQEYTALLRSHSILQEEYIKLSSFTGNLQAKHASALTELCFKDVLCEHVVPFFTPIELSSSPKSTKELPPPDTLR